MSHSRKLPFSAFLVLLAACAALVGIHNYRESLFTHVGPVRYEKPVLRLDMSNTPLEYVDDIVAQPELRELDIRGTGITIEQYESLQARIPDCNILWEVPFQGNYYPLDCESITITRISEADIAVLDYLPELKYIDATACTDYDLLEALAAHRPDCHVDYAITIGSQVFSLDTTEATFPGTDSAMLAEYLVHLPQLQTIHITQPLGDSESLLALESAFPQIRFHWTVPFLGMELDKDTTTTLNLAGTTLTPDQIDAIIPYLPNLTFVDMSNCGISNEEMDALNRRHEKVKIVWTVKLGYQITMRTDALYFMPGKPPAKYVGDYECYNLRYCTDMICVDLGHMPVTNCDWAAYMPHLQFLLLADTKITDISPIANLKELVYLEIFLTDVTDYTPLLGCTALEDINMHYTYGDPEIIKQMTWLKNVWWRNIRLSEQQRQDLRDTLSDTYFEFWCYSSTDAGWRKLPNYYKQRDIMGVWYMD